jgi:hypothetical protein
VELRGGTNIYYEHTTTRNDNDRWWVDNDKYPPGYHRHDGPDATFDRIHHSHDGAPDHHHFVGDHNNEWDYDLDRWGPAIYPDRDPDRGRMKHDR